MHTEGVDPLRPKHESPHRGRDRDEDQPGYEVQDVNVGGIITFLAGLSGFILIFFVFCFFMGKAINYALVRNDGKADKWHQGLRMTDESLRGQPRRNMESNAVLEQKELHAVTSSFPTPQLQTDDGNQDTADLHAREDLLLDYYSTSKDLPAGTIRIPIDQAMRLVVQRGLPKPPATPGTPEPLMAGDNPPVITMPLTDGFARTGYEQDTIVAREQRNDFNRAEARR